MLQICYKSVDSYFEGVVYDLEEEPRFFIPVVPNKSMMRKKHPIVKFEKSLPIGCGDINVAFGFGEEAPLIMTLETVALIYCKTLSRVVTVPKIGYFKITENEMSINQFLGIGRKILTTEDIMELWGRYTKGETLSELAESVGVSSALLSVRFKALDLKTRGAGNKSFKGIDKHDVYKEYVKNCNLTETGKMFNISKQRVSIIVNYFNRGE